MKRIFNNLLFKALALILSLILWLYVTGELERGLWWKIKKVTFYEVPIRVMGLPDKSFNIGISAEKANVVLSSHKRDTESITRDDIILFVNITSLISSAYDIPIEYIVPKDFNIDKIEPSVVRVNINGGGHMSQFPLNAPVDKQEGPEN